MKTREVKITITAVFQDQIVLEDLGQCVLDALQAPGANFPVGQARLEIVSLDVPVLPPAANTLN